MISKHDLRKMMAVRKKSYDIEQKKQQSVLILDKLRAVPEFKTAQSVLCYWSMADEVYTHDFVIETARHKRVYLPVVVGDELIIREFTGSNCMVEGAQYSIPEPHIHAGQVSVDDIDLVVVPGVAFDLQGGRMGRGKGFYDRLLANTAVHKIGICFDFQVVDRVPSDEHDILMDQVITG